MDCLFEFKSNLNNGYMCNKYLVGGGGEKGFYWNFIYFGPKNIVILVVVLVTQYTNYEISFLIVEKFDLHISTEI